MQAKHLAYLAGISMEDSGKPGLAAEYFRRAVADGSVRGLWRLGDLYAAGRGVEKHYHRARICYLRAAAKGSATGMARLARLYRRGLGVPVNLKRAADYYALSLASEKGRISVTSTVARGLNRIKSDSLAAPQLRGLFLRALRRVARNGYGGALFVIAIDYQQGILVPTNREKARRWMQRGAGAGLRRAMLSLAAGRVLGATSPFVGAKAKELDDQRAFYWLHKAAELGSPFAERTLGSEYAFGQLGVGADRAKAWYWLRRAVRSGSAGAMIEIGKLYETRQGGGEDYRGAMRWFKKAAAAGQKRRARRQIALLDSLWESGYFGRTAKKRATTK